MKLFLPDDDLKELLPKLDFAPNDNSPGANLLKLLRQQSRRSIALSHVVVNAVQKISLRDRERRVFNMLTTNLQIGLLKIQKLKM